MTPPRAKTAGGQRLDLAVLAAGLAPTREKARALILAGQILAGGRRVDKPGTVLPPDTLIERAPGDRPFASRGGLKLAGVLGPLGLDPTGRRCLDVGASTGGFTDVLLRAGAAHVTAVDVGKGLIDDTLRRDPRVRVIEELNARYLRPEDVEPPYSLATLDLSFISLTLVLPQIVPVVEGLILALVKPQFEAGRKEVSRGQGVIRDPALRQAAVEKVARCFTDLGWGIRDVAASPVAGPQGNREVFLLANKGPGLDETELGARIQAEVRG